MSHPSHLVRKPLRKASPSDKSTRSTADSASFHGRCEWPPEFSATRPFVSTAGSVSSDLLPPWNTQICDEDSIVRNFMKGPIGEEVGEEDVLQYRDEVEQVTAFCEQATLEKPHRRVVWLDERSVNSTDNFTKRRQWGYMKPLNSRALVELLRQNRFTNKIVPTSNGYDLPCEFAVIGCNVRFQPEEFESWISHSISHFCGASPPPRANCTFCDQELPSTNDLETNWRERMIHIGKHFENGCENMPLDYLVIDYMKENGLITDEQYQIATKYTKSGTKELEDRRLLYIPHIRHDHLQGTDYLRVLKVDPVAKEVSSGHGWHSRNLENRNLILRRAVLILAIFPLLAGFLMGASYLWLNKSMELTESSVPMNHIINFATQAAPEAIKRYFERMGSHLEGLIFGLFILATAALTGSVFAWAINEHLRRRAKTIGLIIMALSLLGGILIGATAEELLLVCLPQGIGLGIMCSWFLGCKNVRHTMVEKEVD